MKLSSMEALYSDDWSFLSDFSRHVLSSNGISLYRDSKGFYWYSFGSLYFFGPYSLGDLEDSLSHLN